MDNKKLINDFYNAVAATLDKEVTPQSRLKEDLKLTSSGYYMIIAEMDELGAEDVTYGMIRKCETMADAADLLLEQLEE